MPSVSSVAPTPEVPRLPEVWPPPSPCSIASEQLPEPVPRISVHTPPPKLAFDIPTPINAFVRFEAANAVVNTKCYEESSTSSHSVTNQFQSKTKDIDEVELRPCGISGKMFVNRQTGEISHGMEKLFRRQRYSDFRGAFQKVSLMMAIGTILTAVASALEERWLRVALLAGVVSPIYVVYVLLTLRREFDATKRPALERIIVTLLVVQCIAIDFAEWARPRLDYGMLVMHFSFVHNFSPLSASTMHGISGIILGLFLVLKTLRFHFQDLVDDDVQQPTIDKKLCVYTTGEADFFIGVLVPSLLVIYQTFVTVRRSNTLRLDVLNQEQLKDKKRLLKHERNATEDMLSSMLPRQIIDSLKRGEAVEPQLFDDATVIFVEICRFGELCAQVQPELVVQVLNTIYLEFDRLSDLLRVYKVETVGQVYMAVVGCPEPIVNNADVAAHFALACVKTMAGINEQLRRLPPTTQYTAIDAGSGKHRDLSQTKDIQVRVGLNTGRLRAGVVGLESPRYKLVGDTVNTASRMESTCDPGRVQCSASTTERLSKSVFAIEDRGEIEVKGKGTMRTSFLNGYQDPIMGERLEVVIDSVDRARRANEPSSPTSATTGLSPAACGFHRMKSSVSGDSVGSSGYPTIWSASSAVTTSAGVSASSRHANAHRPKFQRTLTTLSLISANSHASRSDESDEDSAGPPMISQPSITKVISMFGMGKALPNLARTLRQEWNDPEADNYESMRTSIASRLARMERWFMFVSPDYTKPSFMERLRLDRPYYREATMDARIAFARNLTLAWLLMLSALSSMDYFLLVLEKDVQLYRTALIGRVIGCQFMGILYLLALASPDLFRSCSKFITLGMLSCQGLALLMSAMLVYNNEPSIIAVFGIYVSSYTVCTIMERLLICVTAVVGFLLIELWRCSWSSVMTEGQSVCFLVLFFCSISCSIRLEEFMDHVAHHEKRKVEQRLEDINLMRASGEELLESLLPPHVITKVQEGQNMISPPPIAEHHPCVTIIFTDIKGFTAYSASMAPAELMAFLNSMYSAFDEVITNWGLYKVEIIGDAYFISSGCPNTTKTMNPEENAMRAVEVALALLRSMPQVCSDESVRMRVGVHSGPVVAGVVGKKGPRYHLFGPTVSYAEKMESNGEPSRVHISNTTYEMLQDGKYEYEFEHRDIHVDGFADIQRTWFVNTGSVKCKAAQSIQKSIMRDRRKSQSQDYGTGSMNLGDQNGDPVASVSIGKTLSVQSARQMSKGSRQDTSPRRPSRQESR